MFNILRTPKLFSQVAALFYTPTKNVWRFQRVYILTNTCYCPSFFFYYSHPNWVKVVSHGSFYYQCHFWRCSVCGYTLMMTWNQLYTSEEPIPYYFESFALTALSPSCHVGLPVWCRFWLASRIAMQPFDDTCCPLHPHIHLLLWRSHGPPHGSPHGGPPRVCHLSRELKNWLKWGLERQIFTLTGWILPWKLPLPPR